MNIIPVIGTVDKAKQTDFLNLIKTYKITNPSDARKILDRWLNDDIYTIGYMSKNIEGFLDLLVNNEINTLIDIRYNTMSQYKPDFNQDILKRELERKKINYIHYQCFGVPSVMRDAVIDGFDSECFRKWYRWFVTEKNKDEFAKFLEDLKDKGRCVLLCSETFARPKNEQKHYCHRDFLANLIVEFSQKSPDMTRHFIKRVDL